MPLTLMPDRFGAPPPQSMCHGLRLAPLSALIRVSVALALWGKLAPGLGPPPLPWNRAPFLVEPRVCCDKAGGHGPAPESGNDAHSRPQHHLPLSPSHLCACAKDTTSLVPRRPPLAAFLSLNQ